VSYAWGDRLPTLRGDRVTLRWLTAADVPALYDVFSDEEVNRYWDGWRMTSMDDAVACLQDVEMQFRNRMLFQWGIADAADRIIGTTTLLHLNEKHARAELGFAIGRAHWGKGLARDAAETTIRFAFDELGLHRLEADADPRNDRSLRLLETLGFQREGVMRQRYLANGEWEDAVFLSLLKADWPG
jgi:ribosomal-protein-alanine N-acetyltransferase